MLNKIIISTLLVSSNIYASDLCSGDSVFEDGPRTGEDIDISCFEGEYEVEAKPTCWQSGYSQSTENGKTVIKILQNNKICKPTFCIPRWWLCYRDTGESKGL